MRFVVVGMGGIGGVLAARLCQAGHEVVGLARGRQLSAIREHGLHLETPTESVTVPVDVYSYPSEVSFTEQDVLVLAVKSQDTAAVMPALAEAAPPGIPVLCAQNGVANEPCALRYFSQVYGVVVMCPTTFLEPGTVRAYSTPVTGLLDVGRWTSGEDPVSRGISAVLNSMTRVPSPTCGDGSTPSC